MMNSDSVGPINLGNPIELSMKDLATMVIKLTNSSSNIIYKSYLKMIRKEEDLTLI